MFNFFDAHCDTITTAIRNKATFLENDLHIDLKRLSKFNSAVQIFAIWLEKSLLNQAFKNTNKAIDFFEKQIEENSDIIKKVYTYSDIIKDKRISAILSIEGGESLEGNINNVEYFYKRGVRVITLTWNYKNELGFGAMTASKEGLTDFGMSVVTRMNELKMVVDVSHLNEAGFWDVFNNSNKAFIASHSNAYNVCKHCRNLSDMQIKAIAKKGGMIGINLYPFFINESGICSTDDVLKHIDYISSLIGFEYIGLGCDFDGISDTPSDLNDIDSINILRDKMVGLYGYNNTEKIFYSNFMRFVRENI